jgi:hypothetical protein
MKFYEIDDNKIYYIYNGEKTYNEIKKSDFGNNSVFLKRIQRILYDLFELG